MAGYPDKYGYLAGYPAKETGYPTGYQKRQDIRCNPRQNDIFQRQKVKNVIDKVTHFRDKVANLKRPSVVEK